MPQPSQLEAFDAWQARVEAREWDDADELVAAAPQEPLDSVVAVLISLLDDPVDATAMAAAEGLGLRPTPASREALRRAAVHDARWTVRGFALLGLARLPGLEEVRFILDRVRDTTGGADEAYVWAARAAGARILAAQEMCKLVEDSDALAAGVAAAELVHVCGPAWAENALSAVDARVAREPDSAVQLMIGMRRGELRRLMGHAPE